MPVTGGPSNAPTASVAQLPIVFGTLTALGAQSTATRDLHVDNLPGLRVWCYQSVGPGNVSVQVQFAQGCGVNTWQPIGPPYALAIGVPSVVRFSLGTFRYRVLFSTTGGAILAYRITGILT